MNINQPDKRSIEYFAVNPVAYQNVINKLAEMPYNQVASTLNEFAAGSRAMFDKLPPAPKLKGPGGQVIPNVPEPGTGANLKGNGADALGVGIEPDNNEHPGWTRQDKMDQRPDAVQQYDTKEDCWWVKDPDNIDKPGAGGAE